MEIIIVKVEVHYTFQMHCMMNNLLRVYFLKSKIRHQHLVHIEIVQNLQYYHR